MSEVFIVQNGWIQDGQNSRWLPSSSWVRMNEFELDWISLQSEFCAKMAESKMAEFKMAAIIKLSQKK